MVLTSILPISSFSLLIVYESTSLCSNCCWTRSQRSCLFSFRSRNTSGSYILSSKLRIILINFILAFRIWLVLILICLIILHLSSIWLLHLLILVIRVGLFLLVENVLLLFHLLLIFYFGRGGVVVLFKHIHEINIFFIFIKFCQLVISICPWLLSRWSIHGIHLSFFIGFITLEQKLIQIVDRIITY